MKTLDQNKTYALRLEWMGKKHGGWWLELIDRASGMVKILTSEDKAKFEKIEIEYAKTLMKGQDWQPMYKKGVI